MAEDARLLVELQHRAPGVGVARFEALAEAIEHGFDRLAPSDLLEHPFLVEQIGLQLAVPGLRGLLDRDVVAVAAQPRRPAPIGFEHPSSRLDPANLAVGSDEPVLVLVVRGRDERRAYGVAHPLRSWVWTWAR